jgi:hypothetical protein
MSEVLRRKEIILLICGFVAGMMVFEYFFVVPPVREFASMIRGWCIIISAFALGLGVFVTLRINLSRIRRRQKGIWPLSIWLIVSMVIMTVAGLTAKPIGAQVGLYGWIFTHVYTSLGATAYAITGFYIFSAAYRAFRARNIEAGLLIVGGIFVMLTNAPVGAVIWGGFPIFGRWLLDVGQIPCMSIILITAALGLLAFGLRTILGWERGFYAETGEEA